MTREEFLAEYENRIRPHRYVLLIVQGKAKIYDAELKGKSSVEVVYPIIDAGRVKDGKEALKKAIENNIPLEDAFSKIHDLAGMRIVVYYPSQLEEFRTCFEKDKDFNVSLLKDIAHPTADGYRALHLRVSRSVDVGRQTLVGHCEVQITTLYLYMVSVKTHPGYKDGLFTGDLANKSKIHWDEMNKLDKESEFLKDLQTISGGSTP